MTDKEKQSINNLKKYIEKDFAYREPLKNMSDFDRYCYNHCKDIDIVLNYIENLEKTNEYQAALINDTYINYNDLEFTRIKRRNRELEQEIEELKKNPVNDISKQIINEEIDIDSIEEVIEKYFKEEFRNCGLLIHRKLNELIKAVKQINNKLKEK